MKKRNTILALKLLFIFASFAFILWNADIAKIWGHLKNINPLYLILAYITMTLAQVISAYRMRFYYAKENIKLNHKLDFC